MSKSNFNFNIIKNINANTIKSIINKIYLKSPFNTLNIKLSRKLYLFYENWIIPPQNETLLEAKRREFKERTKYLNPKILYNLSEEEKTELRDAGYFVDLNNKTISEIKNFKITINRHEGKYKIQSFYYNFSLYNTKYYYTDQEIGLFRGDPQFNNKLWRFRSKIKKFLLYFLAIYIFVVIHYHLMRRYYINIRSRLRNNDKTLEVFKVDLNK
jgi:hypothetical protein